MSPPNLSERRRRRCLEIRQGSGSGRGLEKEKGDLKKSGPLEMQVELNLNRLGALELAANAGEGQQTTTDESQRTGLRNRRGRCECSDIGTRAVMG